jgi:DNA-cytosine methyltransferase
MRIGSLFSGYGGLDMAVGGQLAWYAEIEPAACQVMEAHYPDIPNLGDVTKVNWANVEPVDVITGGYPCQPFSRAGIRRGTEDERHLWPYIFDAIRALEPRYAVLENVPGHLTLGFADVLADLASIGWDAEWGTLRASDIGAPHTRNRLFIITYAKGSHESGSKHECLSTERAIEPGKCDCSSTYSNSDGYGGGRSQEEWKLWLAQMQNKHGNGNGHGRSLFQELLGIIMNQQSEGGKA